MNKLGAIVELAKIVVELLSTTVQSIKGAKKRTSYYIAMSLAVIVFFTGTYVIFVS